MIINPGPGDLFEWVYKYNNSPVNRGEMYSSLMKKWISFVGLCICIECKDDIIHWISDKGFFYSDRIRNGRFATVIPRKVEL